MEDVHLDRGQAVEVPLDHIDRVEMPGAVDQKAAPGETRTVLDLDAWEIIAVRPGREQLKGRLESMENPQVRRSDQKNPVGPDGQTVGLVLARQELAGPLTGKNQGGPALSSFREGDVITKDEARPSAEPLQEPVGRPAGAVAGLAERSDGE